MVLIHPARIDVQSSKANAMAHDLPKKMKLLEINPRSPLIEGLLQLPIEEEERDLECEDELHEVTSVFPHRRRACPLWLQRPRLQRVSLSYTRPRSQY